MTQIWRRMTACILAAVVLSGCIPQQAGRVTSSPAAFDDGLRALEKKDFALASYHFAELAKEGNPASMNNLAVALIMAGRQDDAIYWLNKAARFGDLNAPQTLERLGEPVPPADLIGRHPTQFQQEQAAKFFTAVAIGVLVGASIHYAAKGYAQTPSYTNYNLGETSSQIQEVDQPSSLGNPNAKAFVGCVGYSGPGGPCYTGPGGGLYTGPGGGAYTGPGGGAYTGPGGGAYTGPGGGAYTGPDGGLYTGPGGGAYTGPGGGAYTGPGGGAYSGPGGPCYSGPGSPPRDQWNRPSPHCK